MRIWEGLMAAIECMQALYKVDTVSSMFVLFPKAGTSVLKGLYASRNQQRTTSVEEGKGLMAAFGSMRTIFSEWTASAT